VLVIAGSGRGAGKTAVGCALIAAMPELRWTAVKVTLHGHDVGGGLWEEMDADSGKDTGRYLAAGATHAFLISGLSDDALVDAVAEIRNRYAETDSLFVESNRVAPQALARTGERAVCLAVLSGEEKQWKASLRERIDNADALVSTGGLLRRELPAEIGRKIVLGLDKGQWSSPELLTFVRERMLG
jgi:Ni2+-binding GTPase involved in maturation of urease and hydrogenase